MNIFEKRETLQPEEYPHLSKYADAITDSFWTAGHFSYDRDVRDFKTNLKEHEQEAIKRSMLAIGNVENKVKTFWARIDMRMSKPEIADVGHTFAGNEAIHKKAYKTLLELLGLDNEFSNLNEVPCMVDRGKYLTKYLEGITSRSDKEFTKSLILFVLLVENVSLFSQFLIISSFNKHKNLLTNFSAVVTATGKEENIHGQFGAELIKITNKENPEWFDADMESKIRRSIRKAFDAEKKVLDWIFEKGELDFMKREVIDNYLKFRFNFSLKQIGYNPEYIVDEKLLEEAMYFERSVKSSISFDFFNEKSGEYAQTNLITDDAW